LEFKKIILEEKLSNKFKNGHKKFLPHKISREKSLNFMVLAYQSKKSQNHGNPFLSLMIKFSSKMMFLNSKKSFQSMRSEYSMRRDVEASRHFLFYRFETNQMC
jgi:hypothetical protein